MPRPELQFTAGASFSHDQNDAAAVKWHAIDLRARQEGVGGEAARYDQG